MMILKVHLKVLLCLKAAFCVDPEQVPDHVSYVTKKIQPLASVPIIQLFDLASV